jgi:hypothetical protein
MGRELEGGLDVSQIEFYERFGDPPRGALAMLYKQLIGLNATAFDEVVVQVAAAKGRRVRAQ